MLSDIDAFYIVGYFVRQAWLLDP